MNFLELFEKLTRGSEVNMGAPTFAILNGVLKNLAA